MHLFRADTNYSFILEPPKRTIVERDGKIFKQTGNKYLGILSIITEDPNISGLKYKEKSLIPYINEYNKKYHEIYPSFEYKENIEISYDVSIGAPFPGTSDDSQFRVAFFKDRLFTERNKKSYHRIGFTYRYIDDGIIGTDHILNVLPFGFKFQSSDSKVTPYAHFSLGLAFTLSATRFSSVTGTEYSFGVIPGLNVGTGVRIKVKSNYLFTEVTPAFNNGLLVNVGFTF